MTRVTTLSVLGFGGLAALVVLLTAWTVPDRADVERRAAQAGLPALVVIPKIPVKSLIRPASAKHLEASFSKAGFDLKETRSGLAGVPRIFVTALPEDLAQETVPQKKALFIRAILPLVLSANEELAQLRERLSAVQGMARVRTTLPDEETAWLVRLKRRYGLKPDDGFNDLLKRVDTVPVSLALAQAIEESGWGTSRFARQGNALYGQRTYTAGTSGLTPEGSAGKKGFKVRSFMNLHGAVRSYMHNLNTHRAYGPLREMRADWRALGQTPDGHVWAGALLLYSERGKEYVRRLRAVMRQNRLEEFEGLTFATAGDQASAH